MKGKKSEIRGQSAKERVYQTLKITSNVASVFCGQERWQQEDGNGLP